MHKTVASGCTEFLMDGQYFIGLGKDEVLTRVPLVYVFCSMVQLFNSWCTTNCPLVFRLHSSISSITQPTTHGTHT